MDKKLKGSLIIVGTGLQVGGQTTISAQAHIQNADIVFATVTDNVSKHWFDSLNENIVDLTQYYGSNKSRLITYKEMTDAIVNAVKQGKRVCAAFYGHPGVFVMSSHKAIEQLLAEGYQAKMEPGISAEDCLVADLGLDPGRVGYQAFEATQFLFYQRKFDENCILVLWQIGLIGDHTLKISKTDSYHLGLKVLTEELLDYYPADHEVIVYEAATISIFSARIDRMALIDLPKAELTAISTLVIPSLGALEFDVATLDKLNLTVDDVKK
ncbi:MAG: methylase [Alteromonadaceae bacterium]|nr:methylase [Alteromonadaceae bacterium]